MKGFFTSVILLVSIGTIGYAQQSSEPVAVEPGVSFKLATYRHAVISNIQYLLDFNIPAKKERNITVAGNVSFDLTDVTQDLQLDFKPGSDHISAVLANGVHIPAVSKNEHLIIDKQFLHKGRNTITTEVKIGEEGSLNRNADFLYALFVPDRARTVFPCFDQPNLKARFLLTLHVPADWKVLANAVKKDSVVTGENITYHFANSDKLPTYLFSFTAGKYTSVKQMLGKRGAELLYRETDPITIKFSVDSIFKAHEDAISFLEKWTSIPFPFQKVGFAAIPDFQFGGMEHPGEVQYKASALFLDDGATKDQFIARSNVISHETAHMWFGDMVTMDWFNDVWMKEVFANFMADKVTEKLMGSETFNLKFLQDHYPAAYGIDRTPGANPIRQQLDNLQDAGSLYGNIIYHKAPIMMRQLELLMGKDNFQKGIREYLKKYAYSNATWNDLIAILSKYSTTNLYTWNKVWVNQPGRPVFEYNVNYTGNNINKFTISQHPETGEARIWPQVFHITLVYPTYSKSLAVNMSKQQIALAAAQGMPKPLYILFNADGMGYGLFPVDKSMTGSLFTLASPLQRASAYINAYENMLAGRSFKPDELLKLFTLGISTEKNEMNLRMLTGYITNIYWGFTLPKDRLAFNPTLEENLWTAMQQQTLPNNKKVLFKAYQDVYLSHDAQSKMYNVWQQQQAPAGVKLNEDDYTSLALTLALKSDTATSVIKQQQARVTNIDRRNRLDYLMPALSLNVAERDAFFNGLKERKNRQKEAWVTTALYYLNHPLRQQTSIKYLPESLQLLAEIQRTGDVFFPQSWLGSVFGSYQSKEAYQVVNDFLKANPDYNPKLHDKILQATDNLYRAQKMLGN
ncbi:aminopeptidase N [Mucilaginibacter pineti]|uniref:Aminopeptidase N n=1 Tax=Mucilaginibacter pineti TaxID=1391627 RepID=A0A1G7KPW3_9SPHI|nr:M1 family aminopeptidase [Mucilaginibacter pineti]SDF39247.1 aminopeptidase N [Mucilaginibacter pineti]